MHDEANVKSPEAPKQFKRDARQVRATQTKDGKAQLGISTAIVELRKASDLSSQWDLARVFNVRAIEWGMLFVFKLPQLPAPRFGHKA